MTASNLPVYDVQTLHFDDDDTFFSGTLAQTFTYRGPHRECRFDFKSDRGTDMALQSSLMHSRPGYLMPRSGGAIEIDMPLYGSQVDTASGALAHTALSRLLADGLGGGDLTAVGGLAGAGASATAMAAATGTRVRGHIMRVGQKRDTRADGQAIVIGNPNTSVLTAMAAAPGATDVLRASIMVYPTATLGAAKRFMFGFAQTDEQYVAHGCQLERATFRIEHGNVPMVTLRYLYAWWRRITGYATVITLENCDDAVTAAGSYFLQTVGTTTRALAEAIEVEIVLNTGLAAHRGQGGVDRLQDITGWTRTKSGGPDTPFGTMRMTVQKDQAAEADYDADGSDTVLKHALLTFSVGEGTSATEGRHVQMYAPSMYEIGQRPAPRAVNGLLYMDRVFGLQTGPDTTNGLTSSPLRLAFN